ncbi:MAG: hypothetical protein AAF387_20295 [Pseudomonadota bacterium]
MQNFQQRKLSGEQRGLVLVSVLWLTLLLSSLVITLARDTRLSVQSATIYSDEVIAQAAVEGAVYETIHTLIAGAREHALVQRLTAQDFSLSIETNALKIDLNSATAGQLIDFFDSFGVADAETHALRILDFRDKDEDAREGGSENNIAENYQAKNAPFQHVYEITRIPGLAAVVNDAMLNAMTVTGTYSASVLTLKIRKTHGRASAAAEVIVRLGNLNKKQFEIMQWQWTNS